MLTVGLVVYHLLPFDFVLSTSAFHQSLTESIVAPLPTWGAFLETASRSAADWSAAAGQFALLGYCVLAACRDRGERLGSSVLADSDSCAAPVELVARFAVT